MCSLCTTYEVVCACPNAYTRTHTHTHAPPPSPHRQMSARTCAHTHTHAYVRTHTLAHTLVHMLTLRCRSTRTWWWACTRAPPCAWDMPWTCPATWRRCSEVGEGKDMLVCHATHAPKVMAAHAPVVFAPDGIRALLHATGALGISAHCLYCSTNSVLSIHTPMHMVSCPAPASLMLPALRASSRAAAPSSPPPPS